MKVTLVSMVFPHPRSGIWPGIERAVGELARALVKEGASVSVLTTYWNGGQEEETWEGIRIHRLPDAGRTWGRAGYLFSWNVRSFARRALARGDLLRGSNVVHAFVSLSRARRWRDLGLPLFASVPHRERPRTLADRLTLAGRFSMERRFLALAEGTFAGSSAAREVLIADYGLDPSRVHVVPLAVAGDRFTPPAGPRPADPARDRREGIRLLFVGPLIQRKGLRTLVEALPALRRASVPFRLKLVGEGPEEAPLRGLAASLGVAGDVEFEGFVEERLLVAAYQQADLFVFPSLLEGFGLVLVEAMACGLPIVATGVEPMTEVVGDAGVYFPPSDAAALGEALVRCATDRELRSELSSRGRQRVETRFLWQRVARQTLDHYERACARVRVHP